MSLWKCSRSWLDVELRRAGAVVPVTGGRNTPWYKVTGENYFQKHLEVTFCSHLFMTRLNRANVVSGIRAQTVNLQTVA